MKLTVRVIPRARRNEIVGWLEDGTLKVRLTAPPVDGKANWVLINFLAETLRLHKSSIEISSGATSRTKLINLMGIDRENLLKKIQTYLSS